jgi:hypothetical protein
MIAVDDRSLDDFLQLLDEPVELVDLAPQSCGLIDGLATLGAQCLRLVEILCELLGLLLLSVEQVEDVCLQVFVGLAKSRLLLA